eukprot:TRINITY_DN8911_c0_g1_i1.p1 TRINITY_DN8911_c0_g1~~TRINITY_DN8911_c0_g1_i1.p1  ORF type:complete len:449 (+),score=45.49 TRINITY_DN8911_c0_g1_i1:14-1360(+)
MGLSNFESSKERNLFLKRMFAFVFSLVSMSGMGNLYAFETYGPGLKEQLNYTQGGIQLVSGVGDLGTTFGAVVMGTFYDFFGPTLTSIIATMFLFLGYFLMYLGSLKIIIHIPFIMGLFMFISGAASYASYIANLGSNLKNFHPKHRGKVIGLLVSMYGISAALITQSYDIFFSDTEDPTSDFLLFSAIFLSSLAFLGIFCIRDLPWVESTGYVPLQNEKSALITKALHGDIGFPKIVTYFDFWLILLAHFLLGGIGLTYINTIGSIVESLEIEISHKLFVILLSICNCAGRIIIGFGIDSGKMPTSFWATICSTIACVNLVLLAFVPSSNTLISSTICIGLAYGGQNSITPVIVNQFYGDTHYGKNVGLIFGTTAISALAWGQMVGHLYDMEANPMTKKCIGGHCFKFSLLVLSSVLFVSLIGNIILVVRETRLRYRKSDRELAINT